MHKHWHILYTKAKCEKRVAALLAKKEIKNFCPLHCRQINRFGRVKLIYEPLFSCYVFAYIDYTEIKLVKQLHDVINLVYWKGQPAIVHNEEIEEISEFVTHHQEIRLERHQINVNSPRIGHRTPSYSVDGNIVMIKNKFIKVTLPSLGYILVSKMEEQEVIGRNMSALQCEISFMSPERSL
jgi:hypothetical protein